MPKSRHRKKHKERKKKRAQEIKSHEAWLKKKKKEFLANYFGTRLEQALTSSHEEEE